MVTLGLVIARFDKHGDVIDAMERAAEEAAAARDADIADRVSVPGSFDTPLAADRLARRRRIDAVAVLGAIVSGETDHDQVIARSAANGLTDVGIRHDTPVTMGIIGPGMTADQAADRIHYGERAVDSAIDLVEELPP